MFLIAYAVSILVGAVAGWGFVRSRKPGYLVFLLYAVILFADPPIGRSVDQGSAPLEETESAPQGTPHSEVGRSTYVEAYIVRSDPILVLLGLFLLVWQESKAKSSERAAGAGG